MIPQAMGLYILGSQNNSSGFLSEALSSLVTLGGPSKLNFTSQHHVSRRFRDTTLSLPELR